MVTVRESTILPAALPDVWALLRDFNGHERWHPSIAASGIEERAPADMVGAVRRFRLQDGSELREQLLYLSDARHELRYCLLDAPFPLLGYVAKLRLLPVTDGGATFWEWSSEFQPPAGRRDELVALVRDGIYRAGFEAVRRHLALEPVPRPAAPAVAAPYRPEPAPRRAASTRAIVVGVHGGPEVLQPREIALPEPGPGEVQVRHSAIGVNFIDVYCRTGFFDLLTPPGVPGMEAAGVVEAVGPGVAGFAAGDRVAYACPPVGAYAERRNLSADLIVHLPDDISDETAAAALLKGVAASFLLHDVAPVRPGMTVLVHAAAGGIGQLLVQWARHLGARVIATTSTPDKLRLVQRLGADLAVDYTREDFAARARDATGGLGVEVVFDSAGRDTFGASLEALAIRGHLVSYGQASGPVGSWDIGRFAAKSLTVSRPNYAHYTDTQAKLAPHVARLFAALRSGTLRLEPPARYPLAMAAQAHRDLEARRTTGSILLVP